MGNRIAVQFGTLLLVVGVLAACDTEEASLSFCETIDAMNTDGGVGFEVSSEDPDADIDEQLRSSIARARTVNDSLRRTAPADVEADASLLADTADAGLDRLEADGTTDDPFAVLGTLGDLPEATSAAAVEQALRNVSAAAERECGTSLRAVDALDAAAAAAADAQRRADEVEVPDPPPVPELPDPPAPPTPPDPPPAP